MALNQRFASARAVPPGRGTQGRAGDAAKPPVAQSLLALQRLAGNRATQAALGHASPRALQRLVLTTAKPAKPTDSPLDIASKHEVALTAKALAGSEEPSYISSQGPPLDADRVNYVVGHSAGKDHIGALSVEKLAELLIKRGLKDGMAVRLVACNTGVNVTDAGPIARRLAIELHTTHHLQDIAVKGALGILVKTRRKGQDPSEGVSGAYTLTDDHPRSDADLARAQFALMGELAAHLSPLITELDDKTYAGIHPSIQAILKVLEADKVGNVAISGTYGPSNRQVIAAYLTDHLAKAFKSSDLDSSEDDFTKVMKAVAAIARFMGKRGKKHPFPALVEKSTLAYLAACKAAVESWLAGIPQAEGETTKKLAQGNIAFKFGTLNPFAFPDSYTKAEEALPANATLVERPDQ